MQTSNKAQASLRMQTNNKAQASLRICAVSDQHICCSLIKMYI